MTFLHAFEALVCACLVCAHMHTGMRACSHTTHTAQERPKMAYDDDEPEDDDR